LLDRQHAFARPPGLVADGRDMASCRMYRSWSEVVRGFSSETWASYLDAAGYPKASKLPPGYQFPTAVPLSQRAEAPRAPAATRPPSVLDSAREVRPSTRPPTPPDNSGIRF
jgi:hypothetical protein